jgi:glycosyltransferase involved in cell wall biosynthesis
MKIAWFTPLDRRSGVSKYSVSIIDALSQKVDVDVWSNELSGDITLNNKLPIHQATLSAENIERLNRYDAVIYNMGNDPRFHHKIYEVSKRVKGIIILHDKIMHHFVAGYLLEVLKNPDGYISTMNHYYGREGRRVAESSLMIPPPVWETDEVIKYPLFEPVLWNAHGVIVHSVETLRLISSRCPAIPATVIYHPIVIYNHEYKGKDLLTKRELQLPEDKTIILSSGVINRNKRIDVVLKTIGKSGDIRDRIYYVIAGDGDKGYLRNIHRLISRYHLRDTVRLTGFLDDYKLHSYIKNADVCINLRFPSTESCSGSLIEQLYFKKPVIVTRIGFYDEIPDGAVLKVDLKDEEKNLEDALRRLINDGAFREAVAERGYEFASKNLTLENYVNKLLDFIDTVRGKAGYIDFIDRVSDEISVFIMPDEGEDFITRVSDEIGVITDTEGINGGTYYKGVTMTPLYTPQKSDLKRKALGFAWRYRYYIKKIPILNTISKKIYYTISKRDQL